MSWTEYQAGWVQPEPRRCPGSDRWREPRTLRAIFTPVAGNEPSRQACWLSSLARALAGMFDALFRHCESKFTMGANTHRQAAQSGKQAGRATFPASQTRRRTTNRTARVGRRPTAGNSQQVLRISTQDGSVQGSSESEQQCADIGVYRCVRAAKWE